MIEFPPSAAMMTGLSKSMSSKSMTREYRAWLSPPPLEELEDLEDEEELGEGEEEELMPVEEKPGIELSIKPEIAS